MTQQEKELYQRVKEKARLQMKRRIKVVFHDHHRKLTKYNKEQQTLLGDFITILEMDIKAVL